EPHHTDVPISVHPPRSADSWSTSTPTVVLNGEGIVVAANACWSQFAQEHAAIEDPAACMGVHYRDLYSRLLFADEDETHAALERIEAVVSGRQSWAIIEETVASRTDGRRYALCVLPQPDGHGAAVLPIDARHRDPADPRPPPD